MSDGRGSETGRWRFNAQISRLSTPTPQNWLQKVIATAEAISVREEIMRPDGSMTVLSLRAKFDGMDYRVKGSPVVETIAYTRSNQLTIVGTGKKHGAVSLTETVMVDPKAGRLTLDYQLHNGDQVLASGLACFQRDA